MAGVLENSTASEDLVPDWSPTHKIKTALKQLSFLLKGKLPNDTRRMISGQRCQNPSIFNVFKAAPGASDSEDVPQNVVRKLEVVASGIWQSYHHHKDQTTNSPQNGIHGKRLRPGLQEIRTVILLPSTDPDAQIHCTFKRHRFVNVAPSSYSALSYVWGDRSQTRTIFLNGTPLPITKNLFAALRQLRRGEEPLELWVDALCINQDDIQERNNQVRMMGDIYKRATEVLMWLGEANDDSHLAAELVDTLFGIGDRRAAHLVFDVCKDEGFASRFQALDSLLDRQYWEQVWILQEVLLSKRLYVCYGSFRQSWKHWVVALQLLQRLPVGVLPKEFKSMPVTRDVKPVYSLVSADSGGHGNKKRTSLLSGLILFRNRKASDPRDHVYALLNLVSSHCGIQADYSLSVFSLYRSVVVQAVTQSRNLDILSACKPRFPESIDGGVYQSDVDERLKVTELAWINVLPEADASEGAEVESWVPEAEALLTRVWESVLPSWIPDWRIPVIASAQINTVGNCPFNASGKFPPVVKFFEDAKAQMAVGGIHVGVVSAVAPATAGSLRISSDWAMWCNGTHPKHVYGDLTKQKEAFIQTVLTGRNADGIRRTAPVSLDTMHRMFRWSDGTQDGRDTAKDECREEGSKPKTHETDDGFNEEDSIAVTIRSLLFTFCVTENGFMGRVPVGTRVGDQVVVLLGAKVPFVLRKYEDCDGFYLIGECYVHGVMDGELLEDLDEAKKRQGGFTLV
ncbi:heterokaryon incompatibility protein-domain-containing protein [Echria macrotheca]|uniref:Heterokaryon incompatibility protein-domain-containing protein n=1 Tax=Echria macrotheca TaxID=438768 RepID=A0AAJ0B9I6_9PEZI|nr:heterokaryon incompatibility protein-domain-containing protein [Echria macrotheca]